MEQNSKSDKLYHCKMFLEIIIDRCVDFSGLRYIILLDLNCDSNFA